MDQPLI
jgi:ATP-binding cassette, subfamily G (WHITE), eye pigment precursor transporter